MALVNAAQHQSNRGFLQLATASLTGQLDRFERLPALIADQPIVRAALQLAPLLFQRPGELRGAAWAEVDLDAALWTIPAARMKRGKDGKENGDPHLVPLSTQAVKVLRELYPLTGHSALVFPGERNHSRPISENSVRTALITMGYTPEIQTWHGFRATARTMLAERLDVDPLVIEAQLAWCPPTFRPSRLGRRWLA
mgnify:CR=1 FL=1